MKQIHHDDSRLRSYLNVLIIVRNILGQLWKVQSNLKTEPYSLVATGKKLERLKDSAIGNSINHYSDDEVYFNLLWKTYSFCHMYTAG